MKLTHVFIRFPLEINLAPKFHRKLLSIYMQHGGRRFSWRTSSVITSSEKTTKKKDVVTKSPTISAEILGQKDISELLIAYLRFIVKD